ncbi:MAG TPA: HD domain-containing protein, partial [Gemmatales bacterium]|nr:HD domain-containing protein [Gemmatales bacterium]
MKAHWSMDETASLGRRYPEPIHPYRGIYQRDRDRILHASAFRRLTAKTQVLVSGTNDHHRTRLTHTLEVAQVSRTVARELGLLEDLTEAIALAHDLAVDVGQDRGQEVLLLAEPGVEADQDAPRGGGDALA